MPQPVNAPPITSHPTSAVDPGESLADRAYREICDRLVMLDIRPGSPINEDQLGASLGIGRTPVREALKRLAYERLVVTFPRRGTFATDVNITDLAHISEVRQHLEPIAAASAARRATAPERVALKELAERLRSDAVSRMDAVDLMRVDLEAHRALYAATSRHGRPHQRARPTPGRGRSRRRGASGRAGPSSRSPLRTGSPRAALMAARGGWSYASSWAAFCAFCAASIALIRSLASRSDASVTDSAVTSSCPRAAATSASWWRQSESSLTASSGP